MHKRNACGPGADKAIAFFISHSTSSFLSPVSAYAGVSMISILKVFESFSHVDVLSVDFSVSDLAKQDVLNPSLFCSKWLPAELLPDPVAPRIIILSSFSGGLKFTATSS